MARPLSPPAGELRVVDEVPAAFAALVAEELARAATEPGPFRLACSGGPTARACYEALARRKGVAWDRVELLLGDERCVPPDDPDANQRLVREALVERVRPRPRFRPMSCEEGAAAYEQVVASGPLHLVHLGLGPDGHTASLFSDSAALAETEALVSVNEDPSGRNPHRRLTLTLPAIARARLVVFTVSGAEKARALAEVLDGSDVPAARVRAARVVWLCDEAALGSRGTAVRGE